VDLTAAHRNASEPLPLFQLMQPCRFRPWLIDAIVESVCAIGGFFGILRARVWVIGDLYVQGLCLAVVWRSPLGMLCNSETQRV
jgi:hypothetical protein